MNDTNGNELAIGDEIVSITRYFHGVATILGFEGDNGIKFDSERACAAADCVCLVGTPKKKAQEFASDYTFQVRNECNVDLLMIEVDRKYPYATVQYGDASTLVFVVHRSLWRKAKLLNVPFPDNNASNLPNGNIIIPATGKDIKYIKQMFKDLIELPWPSKKRVQVRVKLYGKA